MATIVFPLQDLETADRSALRALVEGGDGAAFAPHLLELIRSTGEMLKTFDEPEMNTLSDGELVACASKLDAVVALRKTLLLRLKSRLVPTSVEFITLEDQCERLDSLAETFRLAADAGFREHTHGLVRSAAQEAAASPEANWRDFLGSLHD